MSVREKPGGSRKGQQRFTGKCSYVVWGGQLKPEGFHPLWEWWVQGDLWLDPGGLEQSTLHGHTKWIHPDSFPKQQPTFKNKTKHEQQIKTPLGVESKLSRWGRDGGQRRSALKWREIEPENFRKQVIIFCIDLHRICRLIILFRIITDYLLRFS